ncbi:protein of unknown function [Acidithiobacillus ferrivorans]|uniref:Uncharacterized protein n=1 Tax=Acidithiobacillus ferrivorans TaxID=160808 RepID=A0A060US19_9PROT|nr:hypothetical protein AFERRI_500027 [Acidithiobacillus ferrivorans]SMH65817.1 protein of unknown function [Acidithiobacillus ferrivorans]
MLLSLGLAALPRGRTIHGGMGARKGFFASGDAAPVQVAGLAAGVGTGGGVAVLASSP